MNFKELPFRISLRILGKYFLFYIFSRNNVFEDKYRYHYWFPHENFLLDFFGYFTKDKQRKIFFVFKSISFDSSHLFRIRRNVKADDDLLKKYIPKYLYCLRSERIHSEMFKKKIKNIKGETFIIKNKTAYVKKFKKKVIHYSWTEPCSLIFLDFYKQFFTKIVICRKCNFEKEFFEYFEREYNINLLEKYPESFNIDYYNENSKNKAISHFKEKYFMDLRRYNQHTNLINDIYGIFYKKSLKGFISKDITLKSSDCKTTIR